VPASKRGDIIRRFQTDPEPRILVMQPQATAHGITLTAADTVVFYGPLMSVEQYIQCIARADRKGQTSDKVTVLHIEGSPIERKMFKALTSKVSDHSLLTQLFENEIKSWKEFANKLISCTLSNLRQNIRRKQNEWPTNSTRQISKSLS